MSDLNKEWLMSHPWFRQIALEYQKKYGRIWTDEKDSIEASQFKAEKGIEPAQKG